MGRPGRWGGRGGHLAAVPIVPGIPRDL